MQPTQLQKLSPSQLVARLKGEGLKFATLTLHSSGAYAAADADWNYKDIPHLHHVHALAEAYPVVIGDDVLCNVNVQKIFGLWLPATLVIYELAPNNLVYFTSLFSFVLVINTIISETAPLHTTVATTYHIGYPPILAFMVPLIKWWLRHNFKNLMRDDVPMRERRGALRQLGYSFNQRTASTSFAATLNIGENNLQPPLPAAGQADYQAALGSGNEALVGDAGLLGLRLARADAVITIWPRACPHEGAALEAEHCKNGLLHCPWHGRKIKPIGQFQWGENIELASGAYAISVAGSTLSWRYIARHTA